MRITIIIALSVLGILAGLVGAYILGIERKAQPPVFAPVSSPYESAIYANGIVESDQGSGSNINIYPEVTGPVTKVLAVEGQQVTAGAMLLTIDDSVQRATVAQLAKQAEAALTQLNQLKAQPRAEVLAVAKAQVVQAESTLRLASRQYDKRRASFELDSSSISKDALDTAEDTLNQAKQGLEVATRQYELTKAGAWSFDIDAQQKQYDALMQAEQAASALLAKYAITAPSDGVVMAINATKGSYVSPTGSYNPYTQGFDQLVVMGGKQTYLSVRCYVDEILVSRLPPPGHVRAEASIRGTDRKVALEFVRVQPYVTPKIELSNQRLEKVDLRVLPVIFRFLKQEAPVYPGQLVDVFIGRQ